MEKRVTEIIQDLKKIIEQEDLNISDDNLFSEALSCYRGEQAGKKFERKEENKTEPASEKQLYYIHKNNLDVNTDGLTKLEASKLISEHKKKK